MAATSGQEQGEVGQEMGEVGQEMGELGQEMGAIFLCLEGVILEQLAAYSK